MKLYPYDELIRSVTENETSPGRCAQTLLAKYDAIGDADKRVFCLALIGALMLEHALSRRTSAASRDCAAA